MGLTVVPWSRALWVIPAHLVLSLHYYTHRILCLCSSFIPALHHMQDCICLISVHFFLSGILVVRLIAKFTFHIGSPACKNRGTHRLPYQ